MRVALLHFSFRVTVKNWQNEKMVSETELSKGARKYKMSKALAVPVPVPQPSSSGCYNTLVMLGVVLILSGYGFAGYMIYKRLQDMESQIKNANASQASNDDAPVRLEEVPGPGPEPAPEPEPVEFEEPVNVPVETEVRRKVTRTPKKRLVTFDIQSEPLSAAGIETLDPSDDL
jgi:hypothetical protein